MQLSRAMNYIRAWRDSRGGVLPKAYFVTAEDYVVLLEEMRPHCLYRSKSRKRELRVMGVPVRIKREM